MPTPAAIAPALPAAALSRLIGPDRAALWLAPLNDALRYADATTARRRQHFLAQLLHETNGLTALTENLCYTTPAVARQTFAVLRGLSDAALAPYLGRPERLANKVYANRGGNGDEASGDGWRFRGRGPFNLTLKGNYAAFANAFHLPDLLRVPEAVADSPALGALSAAWFWEKRDCNAAADTDSNRAVTAKINPGLAGLSQRADWLQKVRAAGV